MDEREFEALIRQYHPALHDYLVRRTGSADSADDILQNVFVRLWENRKSVKSVGSIRAYLFTAVRNAAIDTGVSERARKARELDAGEAWINDSSQSIDDKSDINEIVERAVQSLPPACREVFELYRVYDLSYPEIASTLGVSLSTVKTQMSRAFEALSRNLRPLL